MSITSELLTEKGQSLLGFNHKHLTVDWLLFHLPIFFPVLYGTYPTMQEESKKNYLTSPSFYQFQSVLLTFPPLVRSPV